MDITLLQSKPVGPLVTLFDLMQTKAKSYDTKLARNKSNNYKCKKWLVAEKFSLTDFLSYTLEVLSPYRYKTNHLTI